MRMILTIVAAGFAALLVGPRPAHALNFFELEVYPATTEGQGLHEFETHSTFVANGRTPTEEERAGEDVRRHHLFRTSLEYNYGLTDKIDVAAYVDTQWESGKAPEYAGCRFRARGALFDKGQMPVDLGWYFEVEVPEHDNAKLELEFRPIVSRDFGRFTVDLDPSFELPTVTRSEPRTFEFNYGARLMYRWRPDLQPAIEFFGDVGHIRNTDPAHDQEHYVFPMLMGRLGQGVSFQVGPGFGITPSSDKVILRARFEYEFSL